MVCCDERADNMLWGEKIDHSVGGGLAKQRMYTKRASALSINKCEHGKQPALLEGLRWGQVLSAWDYEYPLLEGMRWELVLSAWDFENPLLAGLRWELDLSAWQAANCLQGGGLRWWRPL